MIKEGIDFIVIVPCNQYPLTIKICESRFCPVVCSFDMWRESSRYGPFFFSHYNPLTTL